MEKNTVGSLIGAADADLIIVSPMIRSRKQYTHSFTDCVLNRQNWLLLSKLDVCIGPGIFTYVVYYFKVLCKGSP